jgi:hypothetical protein
MFRFASAVLLSSLLFVHGCNGPASVHLKYLAANGQSPQILAVYEAWFGVPAHISPSAVGYSSHDPDAIRRQITEAQTMGISAFVIDWYGDREPFVDQSYALLQSSAAKQNFHVAMMYDETAQEDAATDEAIADFTTFRDSYLSPTSPGHEAYLTYHGRPVIFIFPNKGHTDWDRVRKFTDTWNPKPLLIDENLPNLHADAFDGFYAWVQPGPKGWAADGSHWGEGYLSDFYQTMVTKYQDKMIVAGAWSQFNDTRASWSLNRHISARCGQTFHDTFNYWRKYVPANQPIPFVLIATWNDYEEGTDIEPGVPRNCGSAPQVFSLTEEEPAPPAQSSTANQ